MRSSWRLGQWRGVPISLHWTVFIGIPWFYYETRSLAGTAIAFVAFCFLILIHELGHAAVARWRGVEVESIRLFFIHGTCTTEEPYYELDDVLIAWGGVGAQLVVLVIAFSADLLLSTVSPLAQWIASPLLRVLIGTNFFIMIVNLIPVAPFDGFKAWQILPIISEWWKETSWATSLRRRSVARQKARTKELEAKSERIAADIIDKLKKGKSDA
jgi:stage IV sporulation protein FB